MDQVDPKQSVGSTEPASAAQDSFGYASEFLSSLHPDILPHLSTSDGMVPAKEVLQIVALNAVAWIIIQMGLAWLGTRLPAAFFMRGDRYFRERSFEESGRLYERLFLIRSWKDLLPDGARLFSGGFPKGRLVASDDDYLSTFVRETRRGEAVHLVALASSALFFLWNPPHIAVWMVVYAMVSNLPCMLAQRYNRIRMRRVLRRRRVSREVSGHD